MTELWSLGELNCEMHFFQFSQAWCLWLFGSLRIFNSCCICSSAPDWLSPTLTKTIWADTLWWSLTLTESLAATLWLRMVSSRQLQLIIIQQIVCCSGLFVAHVRCPLSCSSEHHAGAQLRHQTSRWVLFRSSRPAMQVRLFPEDLMFVRLLSRCSCSSETRSELRDSGEGSRSFLAAGRQAVAVCILQVHRERQGGH